MRNENEVRYCKEVVNVNILYTKYFKGERRVLELQYRKSKKACHAEAEELASSKLSYIVQRRTHGATISCLHMLIPNPPAKFLLLV